MPESLGDLELGLSANLAGLRRDLEQANQMAEGLQRRWQQQPLEMQWNIAAGLANEFRAAEVIASRHIQAINRQVIRPQVDHQPLFDLNRHLALKEEHWERVRRKFASQPLTPVVDDRALYALNQKLDQLEARKQRVLSGSGNRSALMPMSQGSIVIRPQVDHQPLFDLNRHLTIKEEHWDRVVHKFANKAITPAVDDRALYRLNQQLDQLPSHQRIEIGVSLTGITGAIKRAVEAGISGATSIARKGLGGLANIAIAPIKLGVNLVGFTGKELARGALQGIGRDLSKQASQAFSRSINDSLSSTIGSTELVGRKVGQAVAQQVQQQKTIYLNNNPAAAQFVDSTSQGIRSALGERDVAIEANKGRGRQKARNRNDLELARTGVADKIRNAGQELEQAQTAYQNTVVALAQEVEAATKEKNALRKSYQKINQLQQSPNLSSATAERLDRVKARVDQRLANNSANLNALNRHLEPKEADVVSAKQNLRAARMQAYHLREKDRQYPAVYRDLVQQVAPNLPEDKIPELRLLAKNERKTPQGRVVNGHYVPEENRISLAPDIYKQVYQGRLSEGNAAILLEEIEHAKDYGFGGYQGMQDIRDRRLRPKRVSATIEEEQAIYPELLRYDPASREIERNAKIKARRGTKQYLQTVAQTDLAEKAGPGGIRLAGTSDLLQGRLNGRIGLAQETGRMLPSFERLEKKVAELRAAEQSLIARVRDAQTNSLSATQINSLIADVDRHKQAVGHTNQRITAAGEALAKTKKVAPTVPVASSASALATRVGLTDVHTSIADPWSDSPVSDLATRVGGLARGAMKTITPVAKSTLKIAQQGAAVLSGIEDVALGVVPGARTAKKIIQNTAVPAALYAAASHGPGGQIIAHGFESATRAALSLPTGTMAGSLDALITGTLGGVPMIGGSLASGVSALGAGLADMGLGAATRALAPIAGGKLIQHAAKKVVQHAVPTDTSRARALGSGATQKLLNSFEVTVSPLDQLPGVADAPAIIGSTQKALPTRFNAKESIARIDRQLKELREKKGELRKALGAIQLSPETLQSISQSISSASEGYKQMIFDLEAHPDSKQIANKLKNRKGQFSRINNEMQRDLTIAINSSRHVQVPPQISASPADPAPIEYSLGRSVDSADATNQALRKILADLAASGAKFNSPKGLTTETNKVKPYIPHQIPDPWAVNSQPQEMNSFLQEYVAKNQTPLNDIEAELEAMKASGSYKTVSRPRNRRQLAQLRRDITAGVNTPDLVEEELLSMKIGGVPKVISGRRNAKKEARLAAIQSEIIATDSAITAAQKLSDQLAARTDGFDAITGRMGQKTGADPSSAHGAIYNPLKGLSTNAAANRAAGLNPEILAAQNVAAKANRNIDRYDNAAGVITSGADRTPAGKAIDAIRDAADAAQNPLSAVKGRLKELFGTGAAIAAGVVIATAITSWGVAAVNTAAKFQDLQTSIGAFTKSKTEANSIIAGSLGQSRKFGYNPIGSLESDVAFIASTKDTEIEKISPQLIGNFKQYSRVAGISEQRMGLGLLALQQASSKGVLASEDVYGQFAESIPGGANLIARSIGLTPAGLRKEIATGSLRANDVLPRLSAQFDAESAGGVDAAMNSTSASIGRVQGSLQELQAEVGKQALAPVAGLANATSGAFKTLGSNVDGIATVLMAGLIAAGTQGVIFAGKMALAAAGISGFGAAAVAILPALGTFAAVTAAVYLLAEAGKAIYSAWADESPLKKFAEESVAAAEKIASVAGVAGAKTPGQIAKEAQGPDYNQGRDLFNIINDTFINTDRQLGTTGGFAPQTTEERVKASDLKRADLIASSTQTFLANPLRLPAANIQRREEIDLEIAGTRAERETYTSRDREQLANADLKIQRLQSERLSIERPITDRQALLGAQIKTNQEIVDNPRYQDDPKRVNAAKEAIRQLETQQRTLQAELSKTSDRSNDLTRSIERMNSRFGNAAAALDLLKVEKLTDVSKQIRTINPLDTGGQAGAIYQINQDTNNKQRLLLAEQLQAQSAILNEKRNATAINTYQGTGKLPARLETTTDEQLTELERLGAEANLIKTIKRYRETYTKLRTVGQENEQANADYARTLAENAKDVNQYYLVAQNSAKELGIQIQAAQSSIATQNFASRFKIAIAGSSGSLTDYISGMIGVIEELGKIAEIESNAKKTDLQLQLQKINENQNYQDKYNQYTKPGVVGSIPAPTEAEAVSGNTSGSTAGLKIAEQAEKAIGLFQGISVQCANTIRAVAKMAGVSLAVTDSPVDRNVSGIGSYTNPARANSFGGKNDRIISKKEDLKRGDIVQWDDSYAGINGVANDGEVTHVGIYMGNGQYYHHGKKTGGRINNAKGLKFRRGIRVDGNSTAESAKVPDKAKAPVLQYTNVTSSWYTPGQGGAIEGGNEDMRGKYIDSNSLVMATRTTSSSQGLPYGAIVEIRDPKSGRTVRVKTTDRGTLRPGRDIDLTPAAAKRLGVTPDGVTGLQLRVISVPDGKPKPSYDLGGGIGSYSKRLIN